MKRHAVLLIILLLSRSLSLLIGQTYVFSRYSINNGLPHTVVGCMLQDSKGFLWLGTGKGLVRYDGYTFRVFHSELNNPNALSNDVVGCLAEDKQGYLWIGTQNGLNSLNLETGKFTKYLPDIKNKNSLLSGLVASIYIDVNGIIFLSFTNGLQQFNPVTKQFSTIDQFQNRVIMDIAGGQSGSILVADGDIASYDTKTGKKIVYKDIVVNGTNDILNDQNDTSTIWIATNRGICNMNFKTAQIYNYWFDRFDEKNFEKTAIRNLCFDKSGKIWASSMINGVFVFNPATGVFDANLRNNPLDNNSISSNRILGLLFDNSENMWIGTNGGGVNKIFLKKKQFIHYYQTLDNENGLKDNAIWSLYEDSKGNVWIGTETEGINVLDRKTGEFTYYSNKPGKKNGNIGPGIVGGICEDKDGIVWAITWGGTLNRIDPKSGKTKIYRGGGHELEGWSFRSICCDKNNTLWIGSQDKGIESFDRGTEKSSKLIFEKSVIDAFVISIYQGKSDNVWCGTGAGIYAIDTRNCSVRLYPSGISSNTETQFNDIDAFYEENDSILWMASQYCGIYRLNTKTGSTINYNNNDGLPDNNIFSIYPDLNGNLWMSTGNGISKFDIKARAFRNYDKADGLQSNEFKWGSHFQNSKGELFFGGINGFNIFNPANIKDNPYTSKTVLTDFKISNKTVKPGDTINGKVILLKLIEYTNELSLSYREHDLSFEFSGLHYTAPERIKYACKMDGYDNDWKYVDATKRFAEYTNLPPGHYVFRVKSTNNDGIWCKPEEEVALKITITPPFWKTWWFRILAIILLMLTMYLWYLSRTRRLRLQKLVLERKVAERTSEINRQKEELFIKNKELFQQKEEVNSQKKELAMQADNLQETNILLKEHSEELEAFSKELKAQGEELYRANEELVRLNATKDRFFSIIAHDLKNPFQAIIGFSDLLSDKFDKLPEAKKKELLEHVRDSSKSAYSLLENLLNWARSQTNHIELKPSQISVLSVVQKSKQLLELQSINKQITVSVEIADDHTVFADPIMVETIIRNLLSNAIKFTPSGGRIDCRSMEDKGHITIYITDNGMGMPPAVVEKLFRIDVSQVGRGTAGEIGTGLGLILCQEFAEKNRGYIDVQSEEGKGSIFSLHLPANEMSVNYAPNVSGIETSIRAIIEENRPDTETILNPEGEKYYVLVVEDNPNIRKSIVTQLEQEFKVSEAPDGETALKICIDELPDIVVSDIMMPGMDGYEFCKTLKLDERTNHIPVILLTARVSDTSRIRGFNLGADEYLTKPFNVDVLFARVKNLLRKKEQTKESFSKIVVTLSDQATSIEGANEQNRLFLEKLMKIIEENISDPNFTIDHLAEKVFLSRSTLYRKIIAITDQHPRDIIKTMRFHYAAKLLKQGGKSVSQVMYAVGLTNSPYFARTFKNMFNILPSEYKKSSMNDPENTPSE